MHIGEVPQIATDHVALHREQTDFRLQSEAIRNDTAPQLLVIPDHFLQRKRNLLLGLEADDVGDLLLLDGRELDEACQAALTRDADDNRIPLEVVARQEALEGLARQLI